ncbi:DUF349 domain-containing protein [Constantimarinum furrinae]|uniref:Chromosome segregation protein n=1 Tax=Constantimarinum furrinae TaxID=2562285 RepID=A0A7G8PVK3_9FLAO|nr:DUF349 domain-containing protein [Constantimarinum furrinae]QNJ98369.1 hypothetical protein ALE3EI_1821 [Constantimarinum furrinae]
MSDKKAPKEKEISETPEAETEINKEENKAETSESLVEEKASDEAAPSSEKKTRDESVTTSEETPREEITITAEQIATETTEASSNVNTEEKKVDEEEEVDDEEEEEIASSDDDDDDSDSEETEDEKDYHALSKKELIAELQSLLKNKAVQHIKNEVEEIRAEFNAKFNEELEHKKEEFLAEGGNIIDFYYTTPLKKEFSSLYFDYKEKRNNYYKSLKNDLQANLNKRLELIEELKGLLNAEENINTTYKHFKDIQERWHVAGAIPRDKYNIVWNTYHHHVENFYDFLHLNREFRDLDFKHNLEQKLKLIGRAEELGQEENVNKAFRELQMLHKMWKEEIGPVAKEFRDEVWDKFSAATKIVHDKRQDYLKEQEKHFETNLEKKKQLIEEIAEVTKNTNSSHQAWQNAIKKVQELRDAYFESGKVPRSNTKEIWNAFKEVTRNFNREKNSFYKNQKKEQYSNLEKKRELIKIAEANKDSEDFNEVTSLMKKIQSDWKKIGHVPRKDSDKVWKQFKAACNHYFNRLHASKNEANKEEIANFEAKQKMLDAIDKLELTGDNEADLKTIKEHISAWKEVGRVPYNKKNIQKKFNQKLDGLFEKLNLSKKETELIKFENKLDAIVSQEDERKLQNEQFFISKKIGEVKGEIRQLENNLGFFQNADSNNPLVKEVRKNIAKHKEQLEVWKEKLSKIKSARNA